MEQFDVVKALAWVYVMLGGFAVVVVFALAIPTKDGDLIVEEKWGWRCLAAYGPLVVLCGRVLEWW